MSTRSSYACVGSDRLSLHVYYEGNDRSVHIEVTVGAREWDWRLGTPSRRVDRALVRLLRPLRGLCW